MTVRRKCVAVGMVVAGAPAVRMRTAPTSMMHAAGAARIGWRYGVLLIGAGGGEGKNGAGGVVVERDPAEFDLAQDPALVSFARVQPKHLGSAVLDEHTDAFAIADDRADELEVRPRRLWRRWPRRDGNGWRRGRIGRRRAA